MPTCGLRAVDAVFRYKPFIVERLFFDREMAPHLGDVCRFLAGEKKPYRQVERYELEKIASSKSHGGVVAMTRRRNLEAVTPKAVEFWGNEGSPIVILERIQNPQTFGAIVAAAAYFGVEKILAVASRESFRPSALSYRVARGGLDMVDLRLVDNLPSFLKATRRSYFSIGLSLDAPPLPDLLAICPEADVGKPIALVLGDDDEGLSEAAMAGCGALVALPGGGAIDRLSVEVEAALLMQKYLLEGY